MEAIAYCNTLGRINFGDHLPGDADFIAQGNEDVLRLAVSQVAVKIDGEWFLPDGTKSEKAVAAVAIADNAALLLAEKTFNDAHPVGTVVKVAGKEIGKTTRHRTVGKAFVMSNDVVVPIRRGGKRVLVPVKNIQNEGRHVFA